MSTPHFLKHPTIIDLKTTLQNLRENTLWNPTNTQHTQHQSRLIVIGDSFAETTWEEAYTVQLARQLGASCIIDYALGGSSLWHTVMQTVEYHRRLYQPNDYIYIVTTSPWRLPVTETWSHPNQASNALDVLRGKTAKINSQPIDKKLKIAYTWVFENFCTEFQHRVQLEMLISYVKQNFATNKYLVMPGFPQNSDLFGDDSVDLYSLSCEDLGKDRHAPDRNYDPRPQHFSPQNHSVLAGKIAGCIAERSVKNFDLNGFEFPAHLEK